MPIGSSQYGKQGYGRSGSLKYIYLKIYSGLINLVSNIEGTYLYFPKFLYEGITNLLIEIDSSFSYYPKYSYEGITNLLTEIDSSFSYYPKFKYSGLIELISSIVSEYQYIIYKIKINNYALPETFIWNKAPTYQKSYESFFVSDMHYITKENYSMITIQGILEGTSKLDVENKYKDLVNNVIYVDNFVEMKYKNRTYNVFPINVIKTRFEDFPQLLNVTLIYGLKNFKENEWT